MPPVPVHIDDPITPKKTQHDDASQASGQNVSATGPASNMAVATPTASQSQYPTAKPGAAAAAPTQTPYSPPQPTRTTQTSLEQHQPPPPQSGAVPTPLAQTPRASDTGSLPPPPKAGESASKPPLPSTPAQFQVPPTQQNFAPTHSTTMDSVQSSATSQSRTTLNLGAVAPPISPYAGRASAEHPSGYQQNAYAQELSSVQRSSLEEQQRRESSTDTGWIGGDVINVGGESAGNMWNTVKGWASAAGKGLAETEEQVWKRINGR